MSHNEIVCTFETIKIKLLKKFNPFPRRGSSSHKTSQSDMKLVMSQMSFNTFVEN